MSKFQIEFKYKVLAKQNTISPKRNSIFILGITISVLHVRLLVLLTVNLVKTELKERMNPRKCRNLS